MDLTPLFVILWSAFIGYALALIDPVTRPGWFQKLVDKLMGR